MNRAHGSGERLMCGLSCPADSGASPTDRHHFHLPYIVSAGIVAHFFYATLQAATRPYAPSEQAVRRAHLVTRTTRTA